MKDSTGEGSREFCQKRSKLSKIELVPIINGNNGVLGRFN